jgi:hypothetical protein
MLGLIFKCFQQWVIVTYGEQTWTMILSEAGSSAVLFFSCRMLNLFSPSPRKRNPPSSYAVLCYKMSSKMFCFWSCGKNNTMAVVLGFRFWLCLFWCFCDLPVPQALCSFRCVKKHICVSEEPFNKLSHLVCRCSPRKNVENRLQKKLFFSLRYKCLLVVL